MPFFAPKIMMQMHGISLFLSYQTANGREKCREFFCLPWKMREFGTKMRQIYADIQIRSHVSLQNGVSAHFSLCAQREALQSLKGEM